MRDTYMCRYPALAAAIHNFHCFASISRIYFGCMVLGDAFYLAQVPRTKILDSQQIKTPKQNTSHWTQKTTAVAILSRFLRLFFSTRWKIRALAASPYHNKCETFANVTRLNHILLFYKITWEPYCVCEWVSEWAKTSNRRIFMLLRKV